MQYNFNDTIYQLNIEPATDTTMNVVVIEHIFLNLIKKHYKNVILNKNCSVNPEQIIS